MDFIEMKWTYVLLLIVLAIGITTVGIRLLNQETNDANYDFWAQPLRQRFGFSLTLTGMLIIMGELMIVVLKLTGF